MSQFKRASVIIPRAIPVAPDPRVERSASELARNGYDVVVIAWDREGTNPVVEQKQRFSVIRFRFKAPFGELSLFLYMPFWWFFLSLQLLTRRYDVIHACDLDTALPALIIGKLRRKKLVYDIFDFFSGRIASRLPHLAVAFVGWVERLVAQCSDAVIIPDDVRRVELNKVNLKKLIVIENSPNETVSNSLVLRDDKRFLIFYAGYLSWYRGIQHVVEAIKNLDDVTLVVAGFGEKAKEFEKVLTKTENVIFMGKISHEEVIEKTQQADLIVAFYDPVWPSNRYASPNKLFEAMMCKKPILTNDGTSLGEFVRKQKCGVVVEYGNVAQIRESIISLRNSPMRRRRLGETGRKVYEKTHSWETMKTRLLRLYGGLTDASGHG